MNWLFSPPIALLIYMGLVAILVALGRLMAGSMSQTTDVELYSSGEMPPPADDRSVPGYRPFFVVALFFAVLHLGVIVLVTGGLSHVAILYLIGLMLVLLVLILG